MLSILGLLETLHSNNNTDKIRSSYPHDFAEASYLSYIDRDTYVADSDFVEVPVNAMISDDYLTARAALIDLEKSAQSATPGSAAELGLEISMQAGFTPELPSTTHLSIVDRHGNIASMTTSIETAFGSRLMVNGFLLNNQLTDFSFAPRNEEGGLIANRVEAGKRPRSSMSPTIVLNSNSEPVIAIGSPGGNRIIAYVARTLYEVLALKASLDDAVSAQHVVRKSAVTEIEAGTDTNRSQMLKALGHALKTNRQTSGLHAIRRQGTQWEGIADPRREGTAVAP